MRKKVFLLLGLIVMSLPAFGGGIQAGNQLISIGLGASGPTGSSGLRFQDVLPNDYGTMKLDWGDGGFAYNIQYLIALLPFLAIGVEAGGNNFGWAEHNRMRWSTGMQWDYTTLKTRMDVYSLLAAGRFTIFPSESGRIYIPFGIGKAFSKATVDVNTKQYNPFLINEIDNRLSESFSSFTYYVGLGWEAETQENVFIGIEGRYQGFQFDYGKFSDGLPKKNLSFLSLMVRLGYKF